jgi:outer membrane protein insertion porin family
MHSYRVVWLAFLSAIICISSLAFAKPAYAQDPQQRIVEDVDIQGNRRLRKDDVLHYVQTRPGDVYNPAQVERDLQAINALGFFDKVESRVTAEPGPRGGVLVTFWVKELPILRDIIFAGLSSVPESDVLKAFREQRVGISKEAIYDPVKARNAIRVLKQLLAAKGHPNAVITEEKEQISATSVAITFRIDEGARVRVAEIEFEGSKVFKSGQLRSQMKYVKEAGLFSRIKEQDILHREKLDYDLHMVDNYMRSKGYLQARHGEPRIEGLGRRRTGFPVLPLPFLSSTDDVLRITVPINEGKLFRLGDLKIEGNSIYSEDFIKAVIGLQKGDVANGEAISKALYESLKKAYGAQGFIQYTAEIQPTFKDNPQKPDEGVADFLITIDEGKQFALRRLEFTGNTFTRDNVLRREVLINEGDIYNQNMFEYSIIRLNQLGYFNPIDKDKDADYRTNEEEALVDITLKVSEKGRQEVSFNGGISGIGGSFFGLHYATNNLFGRGEVLSVDMAAGNRQRNFSFSFTEPYIRNRPITAGFSIFATSQKFFGEGTALSSNLEAQQGLFGSALDFAQASSENLFTRDSYGVSVFASSPLSEFYRKRPFTQFSRVGLSYLFSMSKVTDPEVNTSGVAEAFIPIVYRQPSILTSRITGTFAYDVRDYKGGIDATSGRSLSVGLAFAGLLGDVRTYQPTVEFTQFYPIRNKKSNTPHVFAFRIQAGTVGAFAISKKVRDANSLAFVAGVPVYERYFLGDEFSIRGYPPRGISPFYPLDTYITSRNVVLATNSSGPAASAGLPPQLALMGLFTGPEGNNVAQLNQNYFRLGGDTQLLGNFEYRIPIFGNTVSAALFADIGSSFNWRTSGDQAFSSEFLTDDPFLQTVGALACPRFAGGFIPGGAVTLSAIALCKNPQLATSPFLSLVARDNRIVTQTELDNSQVGIIVPATQLPPGFQPVFLRGEAQTTTVARLGESKFGKIGDFHTSVGGELRVQVPVLNVPFRLIYAYNPRARGDFQIIDNVPFIFNEKKTTFRFSVGRTF